MTTDPTADLVAALVIWGCLVGAACAGYWLAMRDKKGKR
jgi:hypothetical protein